MRVDYESLDAFYEGADPQERKLSPEADYGVWWSDCDEGFPRFRVSYVQNTGEVYAVNHSTREVEVLGGIAPLYDNSQHRELDEPPWYAPAEEVLDGWAEECMKPNSLNWVRARMACQPGGRAGHLERQT